MQETNWNSKIPVVGKLRKFVKSSSREATNSFRRPNFYSRYHTGTSLQLRLMRGVPGPEYLGVSLGGVFSTANGLISV